MNDEVWWYAIRAAGLLTWATTATSIVLGLLLSLGVTRQRSTRFPTKPWLIDLHRFVGGMSMVFLALHMVTLWVHDFIDFDAVHLVVPGTSPWRPLAVAWGVVAAWMMLAVEGSSLIKKFIPERLWHGIHLLSYLVAVLGTVHAITAGSDIGNPIVRIVGLGFWLLIATLTIARVAMVKRDRSDDGESDRRGDQRRREERRKEQIELARRLDQRSGDRRDGDRRDAPASLSDRLAEASRPLEGQASGR